MIRTKTEQVINARTNESAIVYFILVDEVHSKANKSVSFYIATATIIDGQIKQFGDTSIATYKQSTFLGLFGKSTLNDHYSNEDVNMISQIDYANKYVPTGEETYPFTKFWNVTADDLEIVPIITE